MKLSEYFTICGNNALLLSRQAFDQGFLDWSLFHLKQANKLYQAAREFFQQGR